jgi:hypothetical protein
MSDHGRNSTPETDAQADLDAARRLLRDHILEALRAPKPKAAMLAVASKFIRDEEDRLARLRPATPIDPATQPNQEAPTPASAPAPETSRVLAAHLASLPFKASDEGA